MKLAQLFAMIKKADLSPEQFASYLGISGMTIRRWQEQNPENEVPELYKVALVKTVENLILEGFLKFDDVEVLPFLQNRDVDNIKLNLQTLGLDLDELRTLEAKNEADIYSALEKVGESTHRQAQVMSRLGDVLNISNLRTEMKESILSLVQVIKEKRHEGRHALVAFGALFYLIAPLDLIPDAVPIFGFVDDFSMLNLSALYYANKTTKVNQNKDEEKTNV